MNALVENGNEAGRVERRAKRRGQLLGRYKRVKSKTVDLRVNPKPDK
jgi:hypothetical protein